MDAIEILRHGEVNNDLFPVGRTGRKWFGRSDPGIFLATDHLKDRWPATSQVVGPQHERKPVPGSRLNCDELNNIMKIGLHIVLERDTKTLCPFKFHARVG